VLVHAQQLVLAAWALLAVVLTGLGLGERRLFGPPLRRGSDLWTAFWMGWALLLVGLQLWHFAVPINDAARWFFGIAGIAGWIAAGAAPWRVIGGVVRRHFAALVAVAGAVWWMSNQAMAGPRFGDTGMYLVPTMHWYEEFPVVPGLANLHVPLGNNITYFLYGALLDGGPFTQRVYPLINTLLALPLVARGLVASFRLVFARGGAGVGDLFYSLALVPVFDIVFSLYLTSPMPDTAVFLFGLVLAGELAVFLSARAPSVAALLRLVFLSAAGLTVKLSIAGLAVATPAMALAWWLWRTRPGLAGATRATALALGVALVPTVPWVVRNLVLSGFPFYPAMVYGLPVDWIARVDATAWIQRPMAMAPLSTIFREHVWWQKRLASLGWDEADVMRPLAMLAVGVALWIVVRPIQWWRGRRTGVPLVVVLVPLAAFVFSFLNTPMPRYQGSTMWMFGIDFVLVALATVTIERGIVARIVRVLVVVAVVVVCVQPPKRREEAWLPIKDFEGTSPPRIHTETLPSGLVVNVPENQVCWYGPLPCTPEPHPGLRLRTPGHLAGGFAIDPAEAAATPAVR